MGLYPGGLKTGGLKSEVLRYISYISETGILNILLCSRGPFRVNSLCSVAIRSSFEAALTHSY